jgi:hypothetical protein
VTLSGFSQDLRPITGTPRVRNLSPVLLALEARVTGRGTHDDTPDLNIQLCDLGTVSKA